jgi:pyruvate dehydrogenase complex dehydrogenase (E1) component
MSETKERAEQAAAEAKAIRQVIAESGAVDFVDVVNAVRDRFRINVTAAQVEEVYHELARETKPEPKARTSVTLTSMVSEGGNEDGTPEATVPTAATAPSAQAPTQESSQPTDDLGHALNYVKSVGGLANAKRTLLELESLLLGGD